MSYHKQDDVIGFCGDYRHPWGCQDEEIDDADVRQVAELRQAADIEAAK
jgi:hypothetical protein